MKRNRTYLLLGLVVFTTVVFIGLISCGNRGVMLKGDSPDLIGLTLLRTAETVFDDMELKMEAEGELITMLIKVHSTEKWQEKRTAQDRVELVAIESTTTFPK